MGGGGVRALCARVAQPKLLYRARWRYCIYNHAVQHGTAQHSTAQYSTVSLTTRIKPRACMMLTKSPYAPVVGVSDSGGRLHSVKDTRCCFLPKEWSRTHRDTVCGSRVMMGSIYHLSIYLSIYVSICVCVCVCVCICVCVCVSN